MDPGDLLACARAASVLAADAILENPDRGLRDSGSGYNTRSDMLSNDAIISKLRASFPDMPILSEEGGTEIRSEGAIWIVDPLDGTWSHHHGGAKWSISIAAVDRAGPICAIVHAPMLDETYEYASGMPSALLNGEPVRPSTSSFPGEWIVSAGAPSHAQSRARHYLENMSRDIITGDPHRPARINMVMFGRGSMALELCHLASGRIDGVMRFGQKAWDLAGGLCIAMGAGCSVEAMDGGSAQERLRSSGGVDEFDIIGSSSPSNLSVMRRIASGSPFSLNGIKNI
jgi:myo-inositol-1(or 4)-monophosphatase